MQETAAEKLDQILSLIEVSEEIHQLRKTNQVNVNPIESDINDRERKYKESEDPSK